MNRVVNLWLLLMREIENEPPSYSAVAHLPFTEVTMAIYRLLDLVSNSAGQQAKLDRKISPLVSVGKKTTTERNLTLLRIV